MEELINNFATFCKEKGAKTYKEVRKIIFDELWEQYKNKGAKKARVESVTDDLTESVALKMGISQDA